MAMIKQRPAQLPPPQPPFDSHGIPDLPLDVFPGPSRTIPIRDQVRSHAKQYAHPLPPRSSDPFSRIMQDEGQNVVRSEHLLRRKTPNGVLHAAYDGTSVEQTERPHAMKHILLPVSEHFSPGLAPSISRDVPIHPQMRGFDSSYSLQQHQVNAPVPSDMWRPDVQFVTDFLTPSWNMGRPPQPQLDSVLNQLPAHVVQQFQYPQNGQLPYGFMPQPFQPSFVPTASNTPGPYGPYWPNGTYQPYLPSATRDLRFYPQHTANWSGFQNQNDHISRSPGWHMQNRSPMLHGYHAVHQHQGLTQLTDEGNLRPQPHARQHFQSNPNFVDSYSSQGSTPNNGLGFSTPVGAHGHPNSLPQASEHYVDPRSGDSTPVPRKQSSHSSTPLDFSATSQNAKGRDRVFQQAVDIYIELLKHLHKSRGHSSQGRNGQGHQVNRMYPKPPRQPTQESSSPPRLTRHHSSSLNSNTRPPLSVNHRYSGSDVHTHNSANSHVSHSRSHSHSQDSRQHHYHSLQQQSAPMGSRSPQVSERVRNLRRNGSDQATPTALSIPRQDRFPMQNAVSALESLTVLCQDSSWQWIDGLLLGGSLAYALADYQKAYDWYTKILNIDSRHVEAMSNLAATLMAMNKRKEAEQFWQRAVKLRPGYFEAVEHLIGLLCNESRNKDAIAVIEFVERSLRLSKREPGGIHENHGDFSGRAITIGSPCPSDASDKPLFDYEGESEAFQDRRELPGADQPGFGSSGYAIPGTENGRIHTLVHARGNLLYAAGDNVGAAKAFEEAVLITVGRHFGTIDGLVRHILAALSRESNYPPERGHAVDEPLLLPPELALNTVLKCFPPNGDLPGLKDLPHGSQMARGAISTTSNSLLSLAKIFQDGMGSSSPRPMPFQMTYGVREILVLYYFSLSLHPSPSTANNVGILLAGVQQTVSAKYNTLPPPQHLPAIPGVVPGTGVALALQYYNFGLNIDKRHAHLYTNLGSLLKDLGQLAMAIKMYEQAVQCDQKFDIALANLANAVKDQGRIADAIGYYQRAVDASPDFAEAVCGLANALNSVCGWQARGGIAEDAGARDRWHVDEKGMLKDATQAGAVSSGWIKRVVDLVDKQLAGGENWGQGIITPSFIGQLSTCLAVTLGDSRNIKPLSVTLKGWAGQKWEGQRAVRLIERVMKRLTWQWYHDIYVSPVKRPPGAYNRPSLPAALPVPAAPTVLPFHTFTSPMSAKQIRQISQRNGLRISCSTLKAPWLPPTVNRPPAPPNPYLKVGYVSSDFNNHPLAHLMQSVFGIHDRKRVKAYCYATTASDNSTHRQQIERESPVFHDSSGWSAERLVQQIVEDGIHILVNLNGYTRGARNEVFAARPAPIQMSFMGFAGTLGAEWCDYLLADDTAVPPEMLRPWRRNVDIMDQTQEETIPGPDDWIYGENIVYCRDTFFCCDHRQSAPDAKEKRINWEEELSTRWSMRKEIFPDLSDDAIILGNFNQLYKIEPTTFRTWLRILDRVPKAVLWLLRFPDLGEQYLKRTAQQWAGSAVASRIIFTDVAPKQMHISRARVCDLFLDTPECNAHTTAADILWSGTPLLTLPRYKYKMCSRMAASILKGALPKGPEGARAAEDLIAGSEEDYENKAVRLARGLAYVRHRPQGRLADLRRQLWDGRWTSALFDTHRWVRDLEEAYEIAWERWVKGEGGDIWLGSEE